MKGRVFQRGKVWWLDFTYQGQRVREAVGSNKTQAEHALHKRIADAVEGRFFPKRKKSCITVSEMIQKFLDLHAKKLRGASHRPVLRRLDREFGQFTLDKVTVPMIIKLMNTITENTSVANANRHHSIFRSMFSRAIEWGEFTGENPVKKIKQQKEDNSRLRFLSKDEMKRLVDACSPRLRPVVVCALLTGMRKGELLKLTWENVDMATDTIYLLQTKSGKPRELPISKQLHALLETLGPGTGSVFNLADITFTRHFRKARAASGIKDFRFHDTRHTFASHFIMNTGDLPALQKLLGHHSPAMTQRYAHLSSGHLRSGVQKLDDALGTI